MKTLQALLFAVLITFPALAQQKADLKLQLEPNKVYRIKSSSTQTTIQTIQGNQQVIQSSNTMVASIKALKVMDAEMIAEVRFDTIKTMVNMPPMEINSANPGDITSTDAGEIMGCIMHRLSNSSILVKMTNTGRVIEFMNLAPVTAGILQGVDSIQGPMAPMLQSRAKAMVEEKELKTWIESITAYLPGKEVEKGAKWDVNMDMSFSGMTMAQSTTYKLNEIEGSEASLSGDVVINSKPIPMEMNGAQITPDISGLGKGDLIVDVKTGWIISGNSKQTMKGDLNVSVQGTSMVIPIEISSESEIIAIP